MPRIARTPGAAMVLLVAMAVTLAGCLLTPGRFTSALDIRKDGRFSFTYSGEMHLLALSKLAEMNRAQEKFAPSPCHDASKGEVRTCTAAELQTQKRDWEQAQASAAESRRRDSESMKTMLGGIDPADPKAAQDFAARLQRQAGWRKVEYKGDGLFVVDFALSGRLDHDFTFPTIERFPMANAFVQVSLRQDGTVRVDAPGYAPASGGEPMRSMMRGMAEASPGGKTAPADYGPAIDGTFTLRTDGTVLANNTDEGPRPDTSGQRLDWTVNLRSPAAPMALLRLAR